MCAGAVPLRRVASPGSNCANRQEDALGIRAHPLRFWCFLPVAGSLHAAGTGRWWFTHQHCDPLPEAERAPVCCRVKLPHASFAWAPVGSATSVKSLLLIVLLKV